jgi:hypothetical protein
VSRLLAWTVVALGVAAQNQSQPHTGQQAPPDVACRPVTVLRDFCRVGCPDPPPTLARHIEPKVDRLKRPLPTGMTILEIGVNLEGDVVSACVIRSLRDDFDKAAQAAVLQWRWKIPKLKGKERGFVVTVTVCTPDKPCTSPERRGPHTSS